MPGGLQLKADVLSASVCALCGACLGWCPYLKNLEDHLVLRFDCPVEDGRCHSVCPRTFTDWQAVGERYLKGVPGDLDVGPFQAVYRVKRRQPLRQQQNGGTVTTLLQAALREKLVDGVLVTGSDGFTPRTFLTDDPAEVEKSAGSRFLAQPGLGTLIQAEDKGMEKLALAGRPCQIQAVRKMQYNQAPATPKADVLTIGLFCMWSLAWSFKDYLDRTYPGATFSRMNIPRHEVELLSDGGITRVPLQAVQTYIRPGCGYCLDMTAELADISVGSFEPAPEWNTVLVRSDRGKELLDKARGWLKIEEYAPEELERLRQASRNKKARNLNNIRQAAGEGRITPFIDLSQPCYRDIPAGASQKEGI